MIAKEDTPPKPWEDIRDAKKAEQRGRIPKEWTLEAESHPAQGTKDLRPIATTSGILSERELHITGDQYDATSLAAEIAKGTYTATEVVTAFCKRAAIGHQLCNSLTEICFLDAIENAKKLDEHYKTTGGVVGPLHGIPITFKVQLEVI